MVNYPHQISRKKAQVRPKKSNRVDFANRGMSFESAINATNDYYLSRGLAVIHKNPLLFKLSKSIIPNAHEQRLWKLTLDKPLLPTTLVFTRDITLILKPKRHDKRQPCL